MITNNGTRSAATDTTPARFHELLRTFPKVVAHVADSSRSSSRAPAHGSGVRVGPTRRCRRSEGSGPRTTSAPRSTRSTRSASPASVRVNRPACTVPMQPTTIPRTPMSGVSHTCVPYTKHLRPPQAGSSHAGQRHCTRFARPHPGASTRTRAPRRGRNRVSCGVARGPLDQRANGDLGLGAARPTACFRVGERWRRDPILENCGVHIPALHGCWLAPACATKCNVITFTSCSAR